MSDRVFVESVDPNTSYPVAATYRNYSGVGTAAVQHFILTDATSDVQAKVFSYATSNPQAVALADTTGTHKYPVDVVGSVGATQLGSPWGVTGSVQATQAGAPWAVTGSVGATQLAGPWTVTGSVLVQGQVASGSVYAGNPVGAGGLAFDTAQTSWSQVGCGQMAALVSDRQGRQRIAVDTGNILAAQGGAPWSFTGSVGATQLGAPWTVTGSAAIQGQVANGAVAAGNPVLMAGFATTSGHVAIQTSGDAVSILTDLYGVQIHHLYAGPDNWWSAVCSTINTSATVMVYSYGTAGRQLYLGSLIFTCASIPTSVLIVDGGSGTAPTASNIKARFRVTNAMLASCTFEPPIRVSSGVCVACVTSGAFVDGTVTGFTAP